MQLPYQTKPTRRFHALMQNHGATRIYAFGKWRDRIYLTLILFLFLFCIALLVTDGALKAFS